MSVFVFINSSNLSCFFLTNWSKSIDVDNAAKAWAIFTQNKIFSKCYVTENVDLGKICCRWKDPELQCVWSKISLTDWFSHYLPLVHHDSAEIARHAFLFGLKQTWELIWCISSLLVVQSRQDRTIPTWEPLHLTSEERFDRRWSNLFMRGGRRRNLLPTHYIG